MLVRAYGSFWNPQLIDWGSVGAGNKGKLQGWVKAKKKRYKIDFWDAKGVYVLHDQFRAVYVGKAFSTALGHRLRNHLTDRFAGRWDMFSWFSLSTVNVTSRNVRDPGQRQLSPNNVANTLEALTIIVADPPLNRKRETLPGAAPVKQVETPYPKPIRKYLEEILAKLD